MHEPRLGADNRHQLYCDCKPRLTYRPSDFLDYCFMTGATAVVLVLTFGAGSPMGAAGIALCLSMVAMFALRHGVSFAWPLLCRRPVDVIWMLFYKLQNIPGLYVFALVVLALENLFIALTPHWPHHVDFMRKVGFNLFYLHFIGVLAFRTAIFIAHLRKREHVRSFLLETPWFAMVRRQPNMTLHITHAYVTGVLTHMVLVAPWYLLIIWADFSLLALPLVLVVNALTQFRYLRILHEWFYLDHWLGHNSEFEFVYLHGTHHDAIPSGLIGVAGNGHLEGLVSCHGFPRLYCPIAAFFFLTQTVVLDIRVHQYIPGIFPRLPKDFHDVAQHSTHHLGRLAPYSFGLLFDQPGIPEEAKRGTLLLPIELRNSIRLDQRLNNFVWNNRTYAKYRGLLDRFDG